MSSIGLLTAAALLLLGAAFALVAALGIARLPDLYTRMHAATKAGTLGAGLLLAASAVYFGEGGVALRAAAAALFLALTAPVAGHAMGRAAYGRVPLWVRPVGEGPTPAAPELPALPEDPT